jgi:beta-glucanase (GH16 family)
MSFRAAGVALVLGAALIWAVFVGGGATVLPCIDKPSDPLCVSIVFPTQASTGAPPSGVPSTGTPTSSVPDGSGPIQPSQGLPQPTDNVAYTFRDEFNGTKLGRAWANHWGTAKPGRWSGSQASVANGALTLTAEMTGSVWEGALVDTFRSFRQQYGVFSARIKVPQGRGLWATFWLAEDWAVSGTEVDVMEVCANVPGTHDGNDATLVHHIVHDATGDNSASQGERLPDLTADWHVFSLDWRRDAMIFSRDGLVVWTLDDASKIPNVPMAVILSLTTGSWCGKPDATTPDPSVMQVDWVRVTR